MNRSLPTNSLIILGTFICGVCFGLYMNSLAPAEVVAEKTASTTARGSTVALDSARADSPLPALVRQLQGSLDAERQKENDLLLKDHLDLFKKYKLSPSGWGENMKVTDEMADFLRMTPTERSAVNDVLAETFAENRALQAQHLKLVSQKDDSVAYKISAYPEGKALRDQFQRELENTLGQDRAAVMVQSGLLEINQSFSNFGAGDTQIELTRTDEAGPPIYKITEAFSNGYTTTTRSSELPTHLAGLLQLDPAP